MNKNMAKPVYLFFEPEYVDCSKNFNPVLTKIPTEYDCLSDSDSGYINLYMGRYILKNKSKEDGKDISALGTHIDSILNCVNQEASIPNYINKSISNSANGVNPLLPSLKIVTPCVLSDGGKYILPLNRIMDNDISVAVDAIMDNGSVISGDRASEFMDIKWFRVSVNSRESDVAVITLKKGFGNILLGTTGISNKARVRSNILKAIYLNYVKVTDPKTVFNSALTLKYLESIQVEKPTYCNEL